jgi:hypothetical protein
MTLLTLPKEILVAIVAALASVVVACFGLITALRAAAAQRKSQEMIEALKQKYASDIERRKRSVELLKEESDMIRRDIEVLQNGRDILRRVIDAPPKLIKLKEIVLLLRACNKEIAEQYAKHYAASEFSRHMKGFHQAKGVLEAIEQHLAACKSIEFASDVDEDGKLKARMARDSLKAVQEELKDHQITVIQRYVEL